MPKRRAKGEGSIYKDKQGYWNAQLIIGYDNGKPKYKKFRSKKQSVVVEKINDYKLSIGSATPDTVSKMSFESILRVYMEMKRNSIRPASFDSLTVTQNLIVDRIGHYLISDLTPELIQQELITPMCDTHAYSTIHKAYVLLNECLNFALDKEYITKNPCRQVKMPKKENFAKKEIRILSNDEIISFKQTALSLRNGSSLPKYQYGNIICLILYTGLRVGELCALKWSDVDFDNKTLSISKSINVVYVDKKRTLTEQPTTKSGKSRTIPLNDSAVNILQYQRSLFQGDNNDYVVNGTNKIADKTIVANSYPKICKSAGISNPSGIHSLRHTFASQALKRGIDIKVISEILGHASVSFTYNTYVHIIDQQKVDAVSLLDDI